MPTGTALALRPGPRCGHRSRGAGLPGRPRGLWPPVPAAHAGQAAGAQGHMRPERARPDRACRGPAGRGRAACNAGRGLHRPAGRSGHGLRRRPPVPGRSASLRQRRRAIPRPVDYARRARGRATGGHERGALPPAAAPAAAGRAHLHPPGLHARRGGIGPVRKRRAPPEATGGDGPPVRRLSRRTGPRRRDRRTCRRLQSRPAPLRVPPRGVSPGRDADPPPDRPDVAGRRRPLPGRRAGQGPASARTRVRPDRRAAIRPLLPHGARPGRLRPCPRHSLPGPRRRGELGGVLLPGRDQRRPGPDRRAVRAVRLAPAERAARHRHRLRARTARGGDSVHLPQVRPRPRGPHGGGDHLPAAQCRARRGQGTGPFAGLRRPPGPGRRLVGRRRLQPAAPARAGPEPGRPDRPAPRSSGRADPGLSPSPVAARRRLRDHAHAAVRAGAHRKRGDARSHRDRMGQGRHRRPGHTEGGCAGVGNVDVYSEGAGDGGGGRGSDGATERRSDEGGGGGRDRDRTG